ncbi:MAG: Veg family protein [Lachnospiraceae bacterium]|nr:Veg family protein [Lachnospiraceae bacterium]
MSQSDIRKVKSSLDQNIGSKVKIRANRGRHKIDVTEGIIRETYPSIFLVEVENKLDDTTQKISFSYTDVLTRDVQMQLL